MKKFLKWVLILAAVILAIFIVMVIFSDVEYEEGNDGGYYNSYANGGNSYYGNFNLGSASELDGTTLFVSFFADDSYTNWEGQDDLRAHTYGQVSLACDWLSSQCSNYGKTANMIYDWYANPDLAYDVSLEGNLMNAEEAYESIPAYLDSFDYATLMKKYNADNVVFMLYVNTPSSNTKTSWTHMYMEPDDVYPLEYCVMYMNTEGERENAAAMAHEILHTFGAPDLYKADEYGENFGITQEYVDYMVSSQSNDIMYTVYDQYTDASHFDYISNEFTDIDAYYVGLIDFSSVVSEWGFAQSQH